MHFISALLLAAATAVAAAGTDDVGALVAQIPACAFPCFTEASKTSGCSLTDYKCMCSKMLQTQNAATTCLTNSCQVEDLSKLATVSSDICKAIAGDSGSGTATATAKPGGGTAAATGTAPAGNASGAGGGAAATATGTAPVRAGAGRSVSVTAVGVAGLAVVAAAALVA